VAWTEGSLGISHGTVSRRWQVVAMTQKQPRSIHLVTLDVNNATRYYT
jgi:hypothetical protein